MPLQASSTRVPLRLIIWLATGLLIAASLTVASADADAAGSEDFGIAVGGNLQNQDAASLARDLDLIRDAGARWVRIDINWAQIQSGGPNSYYWTDIDRVVQGANARGLKVLGLIVYTPGWARPANTSASYGPDPQTYASFAAKAVQHYSAMGVQHYEIWNEPNIKPFWTPRPDPAAYTRMLRAAYSSIKAVNPNATVLTGGTSPAATNGTDIAPVDFVRGIYANGGKGSFDALAHHPYGWPAFPGETQDWNAWHQMNGTSPSLRSTMVDNGDGAKKIWATEFGAPTNGPSGSFVSEATQAEMITRAHALWRTYSWAGGLFTYHHRDQGTTNDTRENHFGLVRANYSPKPAFAAYKAATAGAPAPAPEPAPAPAPEPTPAPTPTDPAPTEPDPTDVAVKGKGKGKGMGKVEGRVRTTRASRKARPTGRVVLGLYKRTDHGWRPASRARRTALSPRGRFRVRLRSFDRKLSPGTYRVRARYPGTKRLKPSSSQSRRFKLRV